MIELTIQCNDELAAYEISTFATLKKLATKIQVVKDGKVTEVTIQKGVIKKFINEKAVARIVPNIKAKPIKKIIDKHIRK